ncbi:MAG: heparinase II/III family protein [Verrucomicrobiae bacterium]|nr:heparinase II/III family protein [Verrucomicrobiae bacterium]
MNISSRCAAVWPIFPVLLFLWLATPAFAEEKIAAARIREIAAMLPEQPAGFAWPITNRAAWQKLAADPAFAHTISDANKLLAKPLADVPDSLFLEFSKNGNRTHWQDAEFARRERIDRLVLAEAFENQGRFLPALEKTIAALCAEKTWVYPAHDGGLANFNGKAITPDLGATGLSAELAEADYVLGDKLSPATRQLIRDNIRRRVLEPFRAMLEGRQKEQFWIRAPMNWNAVCVGNSVFAALALEPKREERAYYAAAGEHCIRYFLSGFTPDGYCAEGIGYWNYGFGHFTLLTETLRQATGGKIDLLDDDKAIAPALYCRRSEIFPGIFPTIADCSPGTKPSPQLTAYVCRRLGLDAGTNRLAGDFKTLALTLMLSSLGDDVPVVGKMKQVNDSPLRSFFPGGGVLISRTAPQAATPFAVVLKGGHNNEPHNHNDVGSFSVVLGQAMVICDPGGEVYTKRTFGPHRYDSNVLNSYGHAVPLIAGQMQKTGADARGVILETNFTADADTFTLDIHTAYAVPELQKLERTFVFQRGPQPALEVADAVSFSEPQSFETALITWGDIKQLDAKIFQVTDGGSTVQVTVDTGGRSFHTVQELIDEDVQSKRKPYRLAIVLDERVTDATVRMHIEPVVK